MLERAPEDELSALLENARAAEPAPLDALSERRMVRVALAAAERRALAPWRRRAGWSSAAAAAVGILWLAAGGVRERDHLTQVEVSADGLPLRLSLRTGDALVLAQNAKIEVLAESPKLRRVRIERGSVLFDVARLQQGQLFEVQTGAALVRVRGTVFTVNVERGHSLVQVHEGSVWVGQRVISAGRTWASHGSALAPVETPFKADIAAALLARRAQPTLGSSAPTPHEQPLASVVALQAAPEPAQAPKSKPAAAPQNALDIDAAEALLRAGEAATVLKLLAGWSFDDPRYQLVVADALRATGSFGAALVAYEELATKTTGSVQTKAGFAAAQLAWHELRDAERTLRYLARFKLDDDGSPLRERASALHIDALWALNRKEEARLLIQHYLTREPETETSKRLRRLAEVE